MVAATYMASQPDLNSKMREILVDWLLNVHSRFNLLPETMFLAVIILDRFLEKQPINRTKLQLAGCAALLLASKYEEISCPQVSDFVHVTDNTYSKQQILVWATRQTDHCFHLTLAVCFSLLMLSLS